MLNTIVVEPSGAGWAVRCADAFKLEFRSGSDAETAARALGEDLARNGGPTEIQIYVRDGSLAGRFFCPTLPAA